MLQIKRLDKISNDIIYERTGQQPLTRLVQELQLSWVGHALRRDANDPSKIVVLYEPAVRHGATKLGAHRLTYKKYIASILTSTPDDLSVKQIESLASDKKKWKRFVADRLNR